MLGTGERADESLDADREREGLVGLLAAERGELVLAGKAEQHVAVGRLAHRHVGDQRSAVRARDADGDRVRPGKRGTAVRRSEAPR